MDEVAKKRAARAAKPVVTAEEPEQAPVDKLVTHPPVKGPTKAQVAKVATAFAKFRKAKNAEAAAKQIADELKTESLLPALVDYGQRHGDKGQHLAIELPEPIDGYGVLVRRTNVSRLLDVDKAEELATEKGILPEVQVGLIAIKVPASEHAGLLRAIKAVVKERELGKVAEVQAATQFSQDALMAYHQQHRDEETALETARKAGKRKAKPTLTEAEVDALIVEEKTYSFHPEKKV